MTPKRIFAVFLANSSAVAAVLNVCSFGDNWRMVSDFFFISRNMTRMNYGTISFLIFMCDYEGVKDNQTRKTVRAVILGDSKLQLIAFEKTCHVFR